jgi:hypothetical protein
MKFCLSCNTEKWRTQFIDVRTGDEHETCYQCLLASKREGSGPISSQYSLLSTLVSYRRQASGVPFPGPRQRAQERLYVNNPPLNKDSLDWRTNPALTDANKKILESFHRAIERETMETCVRCDERWFAMGLDDNNVCVKCRQADLKKEEDEPFLYSSINYANPGEVDPTLPKLTIVEELLIARVHTFVEVYLKRGAQYRYKGHVINFMRNVGKVYNKLPLLPGQLDVILLRPANAITMPRVQRQFRRDLRVRRSAVRQWLEYLVANHPGYRGIVTVDYAALAQLPDDASIKGELLTQEVEEVDISLGDDDFDEDSVEDAE